MASSSVPVAIFDTPPVLTRQVQAVYPVVPVLVLLCVACAAAVTAHLSGLHSAIKMLCGKLAVIKEHMDQIAQGGGGGRGCTSNISNQREYAYSKDHPYLDAEAQPAQRSCLAQQASPVLGSKRPARAQGPDSNRWPGGGGLHT